MKKRRVLVTSANVLLGLIVFWCWSGYVQGQADFRAILDGREPIYAQTRGWRLQ